MPFPIRPNLPGLSVRSVTMLVFALACVTISLPVQARSLGDNGRCDDPRYETSNRGRAEPGTDEYDCSRWGHGLKGFHSSRSRKDASGVRRWNLHAENGRCEDPRYETSNGGWAEPGTDEYDCSRYGHGLKKAYRKR